MCTLAQVYTRVCTHARLDLIPLTHAHLDTHNAPAQRLFFDWGKKKPRSMAGLRVCIM
jgi:hypothetical protein